MAEIQVRPAADTDLAWIAAVDNSYSTDYVWQVDIRDDASLGQIQATFRPVRLPRSMRVSMQREPDWLTMAWERRVCFLVAEQDGHMKGYLNLALALVPETAWVTDFGVERRFRRSGVGTVLLTAAAQWARTNRLKRLVLEMQSKNHPAISFAQKHGFVFSGYNDRYYPNQDVALFFGMVLK